MPREKLTNTPNEPQVTSKWEPKSLNHIIGQEEAVTRLRAFTNLYVENGKVPGHILVTGGEGSGKTALCRAYASEFGRPIREADARSWAPRTGDIMGFLTNLGDGAVGLLQNLERLPKLAYGMVLAAATDFKVDLVVDKGMFAKTIQVPLKEFTLMATAVSEGQCARDLLPIFAITVSLRRYAAAELQQIAMRIAEFRAASLSLDVAAMVADASDGTPRSVESLTRKLLDLGKQTMTINDAAEILKALGFRTTAGGQTLATCDFDRLSGVEFERLVCELLNRMGFHADATKASGDGGIDIVASLDRPLVGGRYLIQCKRQAPDNLVGSPVVREFYGAVRADGKAVKGILITTSDFTTQAKEFARDLPIELINRSALESLISGESVSARAALPTSPPLFGDDH